MQDEPIDKEDILKELATELNLPIGVHSMSKGIIDIATNNIISDEKNIMGTLDYIGEQIKIKEIFPSKSSYTCCADVGLTCLERFALGATMGISISFSNACAPS